VKKRVYFDTSAVIKEFVLEVGSDLVDDVSNAAKAGNLQIITSIWSINEAVAVIDRLARKPKEPLSKVEQQQIIATIVERVKRTNEHAAFRIAPIDHAIVVNSRLIIDEFHISTDDALQVYTGWIYDCGHFLIHDNKIAHRLKAAPIEGMKIIDLGDPNDHGVARSELNV
jgi:predicted nucleic acid-binding protein